MAWRGCVVKWVKTELVKYPNNISRSSRLHYVNQQRCGFRREAKKPETKKENATQQTKPSPPEAGTSPPAPKLRRPTLFGKEQFLAVYLSAGKKNTAYPIQIQHRFLNSGTVITLTFEHFRLCNVKVFLY
uniref:Uncharacterized protein n=1 Tax=Kryptolebias marmoratus TaxID=37003 RepID=A0A3Q3BE26_KRYMA